MTRVGSGLQFGLGVVLRVYHKTGYGFGHGFNGNYGTRWGHGDGFGSGDGSGRGFGSDNYGVGSWLHMHQLDDVWRRL